MRHRRLCGILLAMKVIGLMSGTSADGIDAALTEISGHGWDLWVHLVAQVHRPYDAAMRQEILACCSPQTGTVDRLCRLNFALGESLSQAAQAVAQLAGLPLNAIDLIGSHGQTVWHDVAPDGRVTSTLQIGEAAVVAERTGVPTIADFRVGDVAAGGQGAPLVPFVDYILFRDRTPPLVGEGPGVRFRAVQNIGGIANVTLLPPNCTPEQVIAFDTGPGNMVIDALVEKATGGLATFDRDGRRAAAGRVDAALLGELLAHPYLHRPPPKTTGRELFGRQFAAGLWERGQSLGLSADDLIATATAFTAESVAQAYRDALTFYALQSTPIDEVILGGGGADNPTLVNMLAKRIAPTRLLRCEDFGLPTQAKEAIAFAVLAYAAWQGEPNNLPSVTGAKRHVIMGKGSR